MKYFKVVVWGDSIPAGGPGSWPEITEHIHNNFLNTGTRIKVVNSSIDGKPAAAARDEFAECVLEHDPQLVFIQFGLSDMCYDGRRGSRPVSTPKEFKAHLKEMIVRCKGIPAKVIIFGNHQPAPVFILPDGKTYPEKVMEYNAAARKAAQECNVEFHDMSQLDIPGGTWRDLVGDDYIKLSELGRNLYGNKAATLIMRHINNM
ncbi:SGNH/GDSL hydrolase family protein [Lentisphaerota bacterium ZTH]|nr:SGNH/GDSL hydrolase family protein [Lentisphaerota bacterium]WET06153.1 SGNH/GDSL hydrolase family protein [Lentisphaerota bacterium ZTH]